MKDYYAEINKVIKEYEDCKPYHSKTLEWAANKIDWCWKWRKITKDQMEELANRITIIYEEIL